MKDVKAFIEKLIRDNELWRFYKTKEWITLRERILKENNYEFFIQNNNITIEINTTLDSIKIIDDCRIYINSFEVIKGSMDDVFLNITKGDK